MKRLAFGFLLGMAAAGGVAWADGGWKDAWAIANYTGITGTQHGLTKREYFAAAAMQGILADGNLTKSDNIAQWAWAMADAMERTQ